MDFQAVEDLSSAAVIVNVEIFQERQASIPHLPTEQFPIFFHFM